jgi:hypothetical protein
MVVNPSISTINEDYDGDHCTTTLEVSDDDSQDSHLNSQHDNKTEGTSEESDSNLIDGDDYEESYLILGGKNLSVSVNVCNCSALLFMHGSDLLNESAMELKVHHVVLTLTSCQDNENLSFTIDCIAMTACRLAPSMTNDNSFQIGAMPLKKALLIENVQVLYKSETLNDAGRQHPKENMARRKVKCINADDPNSNTPGYVFVGTIKLRLNVTLSTIVINLSPTVILVLSGFHKSFRKSLTSEKNVKDIAIVHGTSELQENQTNIVLE